MEPYVHTVDHRLSVVRVNSELLEDFIDNLIEVVDFVLDNSSTEHLIIRQFIGALEAQYYHFDSMIDLLNKAYIESKGDVNET